jgi:hypothetical protein
MVFDANIEAKGDRTDHSFHHTEVSLVSLLNKSIFGTLGIVAVITTVTSLPTRPSAGHILAQGRQGAQEEGEAHQGGHRLHHYTEHRSFYLKKDVTRCGGEESELIYMIERIYLKKKCAFIPRTRLRP